MDGAQVLNLGDHIFYSDDDFIVAFQNNLTIAFGAAMICLNRAREESQILLPQNFDRALSTHDQIVILIYQARNAFAHDIAEPIWRINNRNHRRRLKIRNLEIDLEELHNKNFSDAQIGGVEMMFWLCNYALQNFRALQ